MQISGRTAAEIFESVRTLCQSRQLLPGQTLPPVRDLATSLGVNRNTVAVAYKRLVGTGIAVAQGRLGTAIRSQQEPGEQEGTPPGSPLVDLASGSPSPIWLPDAFSLLKNATWRAKLYGEDTVNPQLSSYARQWLGDDSPLPFEVDLTHGAVDGIERVLATALVAGDKVAVEHPCFLGSISTLRMAGLNAVGVPVDEEGMQVEALEQVLQQGAQAVLLTPRAHNPLGCSLTQRRAASLRDVLACYPQVMVILDDHFALLSEQPYHSVIPDGTSRWALLRSVSKGLGPDLRLAFVASDPETSRRLRLRLAPGTMWISHILQDIVGLCLHSTEVMKQIERAKTDYAMRREWLLDALQTQGISVSKPCEGLNVWIPLRHKSDVIAFDLAKRGWLVRSGNPFGIGEKVEGIRITIATLEKQQAICLASDLNDCIKRYEQRSVQC